MVCHCFEYGTQWRLLKFGLARKRMSLIDWNDYQISLGEGLDSLLALTLLGPDLKLGKVLRIHQREERRRHHLIQHLP